MIAISTFENFAFCRIGFSLATNILCFGNKRSCFCNENASHNTLRKQTEAIVKMQLFIFWYRVSLVTYNCAYCYSSLLGFIW